jgi:all-trans-retinol 13,14-reductase
MKYDYVVIGAGISGLASAIILAKNNRSVVLVEKSVRTGPLLRGFRRNGILFDTGFHHAGGIGNGEAGDIFFRYLGLSDRLKKVPGNPDCFDIVRFPNPDFEFRFPVGYDKIRERLHGAFPGDKYAVDEYLSTVKKQCSSLPYLNLEADFDSLDALEGVNGQSLGEFLGHLTGNERLKSVLSIHCLLNGVPPDEQALSNYSYIVGPYYESVNRIQGGGDAVIREFENAAADAGVDVFCGKAVTEISFSPGGVLEGVRLQDDSVIESKACISTVHPLHLLMMVKESLFRPSYVTRLKSLEETSSAFILYGESDTDLDILSGSSIFLSPTAGTASFNIDRPIEERPFNIASSCPRKDSGKNGFIAMCPGSINETRQWEDSVTGNRPEAYLMFKEEIGKRMLQHIELSCPEFKGKMKLIDCSTPLTLRDYANSPFGSMYGVKHKLEQYNPFPVTRLKGLFLAGQSIISPGLLGALMSAFIICGNILGHNYLREELKKCN